MSSSVEAAKILASVVLVDVLTVSLRLDLVKLHSFYTSMLHTDILFSFALHHRVSEALGPLILYLLSGVDVP